MWRLSHLLMFILIPTDWPPVVSPYGRDSHIFLFLLVWCWTWPSVGSHSGPHGNAEMTAMEVENGYHQGKLWLRRNVYIGYHTKGVYVSIRPARDINGLVLRYGEGYPGCDPGLGSRAIIGSVK